MIVEIKKMGINGEGIGYINQLPVFVEGALIGEEVDIHVIERKRTYAIAEVNRIIKKSSHRVNPKCDMQHRCKMCPLMVCKYDETLKYKKDILKQTLIKYAQVNPRLIEDVKASPNVFQYRNQFKMPVSKEDRQLETGFFLPNSNYFVGIEKCMVHDAKLEKIRQHITYILNQEGYENYRHKEKRGIRNLIVRGLQGKYQCTIVTGLDEIKKSTIEKIMQIEGMVSLWQSVHTVKKTPEVFGNQMNFLAGQKLLPFELDGIKMNISPRSFFQLNSEQAKVLYRTIKDLIPNKVNLIVEAYSGIGGISMYLKDKAKEIIGIESVKDAVVNANQNAKLNKLNHVSFICDDAANKLLYLSKTRDIDVLVVDPPRSGLSSEMIECITRSKIKKVIYISCNPATLGKDLQVLLDRYQVEKIIPLDMFPHTAHIESITVLNYNKKGGHYRKEKRDGGF